MLTELEGAILAELHTRGHDTAFQVRRAFATSLSLEWKGSAGSVYPAVKRLEQRGLIAATAAQGGRGTRQLSLTDSGEAALMAWACDIKVATSVGLDPFRLRSNLWAELSPDRRAQVFAALRAEIAASLPAFQKSFDDTVPAEQVRVILALQVQRDRLRTLDLWEAGELTGRP
jgi:DNA-binding PadR family transcriptional regulator